MGKESDGKGQNITQYGGNRNVLEKRDTSSLLSRNAPWGLINSYIFIYLQSIHVMNWLVATIMTR